MKDIGHALARAERANAIAEAGGVLAAVAAGTLPSRVSLTVSEAVVVGLAEQGVRTYLAVFGHGSTEIAEVLRVYEAAGVVRTVPMRHETAAAHAATALRWVTGEKAAVVTSIGPGALHAFAGSLASASDGIGVWHLYGDESTEDEGPNMQQIPKSEQGLYLRLTSVMGGAYSLHTAGAVGPALRRGMNVVDDPHRAGPFFLMLPLNTQPFVIRDFNLRELPTGPPRGLGPARDDGAYAEAARVLMEADRVVVRVGGGARQAGDELLELMDLVDGVAVVSPIATGVVPYSHPRVMGVGGTKGSLSGNFAMEGADALLVVGSRSVCQADCSRTGYPNVRRVVNINTDVEAALHYNRTVGLVGDAGLTLARLVEELRRQGATRSDTPSEWLQACAEAKQRWAAHKQQRYDSPRLYDEVWGDEVLTQAAAIKVVTDWAKAIGGVAFFDAGDVQANGFQIVEDESLGQTITETGASYMGFASSALLAGALAEEPFYGVALTGDGSFTMNPQILIDGVANGVRGCIVLFDNRRMAAISSLQVAQYGQDHATSDGVAVDYLAWARAVQGVAAFSGGTTPETLREALDKAHAHDGLSLVHVPVYYGENALGGLGAFGRWNVGNWVEETQRLRHDIAL